MISLDTFRIVADNSKIGKTEALTFGDDDKTVICGVNGRKRAIKVVDDIERKQNAIYMRSSLLSGIRDRLGLADDSAMFKRFERLIFGDLVNGRFDAETASKPLVRREIKAIFTELDAATREHYKTEKFGPDNSVDYAKHKNHAGVVFSFGKTGGTDPRPFCKQGVDTQKFAKPGAVDKIANKHLTAGSKTGEDLIYKGVVTSLNETKGNEVPVLFTKDLPRLVAGIILPDGTRINAHGDDEAAIQVHCDRLAEKMTKGRVKRYRDLTGKDLKLVQFTMAMTNQRTLAPLAGLERTMMNDESWVLMLTQTKVGFQVSFNENGSVTFRGFSHSAITAIAEGMDMNEVDRTKSELGFSYEITYSAEKLDTILEHDWSDPSVDWLKPNNREFYFTCHIEA